MKVKTFKQWFEDQGDEKLPENEISGEWFHTHRLPMIVSCCECGTTMALPFAYITEEDCCLCDCCAGVTDSDEL